MPPCALEQGASDAADAIANGDGFRTDDPEAASRWLPHCAASYRYFGVGAGKRGDYPALRASRSARQ